MEEQLLTQRQQQAINTKKKLISISLELIKEHGFDNVTINDICTKAEVSTGAFYHHIKNKAGIIVEGYSECDDYFINVVYKQLKALTAIDKIVEYISYQAQYAIDIGIDSMIQIYKAQITEGNEFFLSQERGLPAGLLKLVEEGQKNGELIDTIPAEEISKELLIISRGIIYNWCQAEGKYDLVSYTARMIFRYLTAFKK